MFKIIIFSIKNKNKSKKLKKKIKTNLKKLEKITLNMNSIHCDEKTGFFYHLKLNLLFLFFLFFFKYGKKNFQQQFNTLYGIMMKTLFFTSTQYNISCSCLKLLLFFK